VKFEPLKPKRYPGQPWKPSPEDEEILRRWRERRDKELARRLRELRGRD